MVLSPLFIVQKVIYILLHSVFLNSIYYEADSEIVNERPLFLLALRFRHEVRACQR